MMISIVMRMSMSMMHDGAANNDEHDDSENVMMNMMISIMIFLIMSTCFMMNMSMIVWLMMTSVTMTIM